MPVGAGGDGWRRCTKRKGDKGQTGEELTSGLLAKGSETRRVKTPGKEMAAVVTVADARRGCRTCSGLGRFGSLFRTSEEEEHHGDAPDMAAMRVAFWIKPATNSSCSGSWRRQIRTEIDGVSRGEN
jgi:hypothetical protein